jgi:hypothetical protein
MNLTAIVKTTICAVYLSLLFCIDVKAQTLDSTSTNTTLPANNFIQFDALKFGNNIELKWRASGKGKGQFIVERSKDGMTFQKIGSVELSKVTGTFNYVYTDRSPIKDKNYYRIRFTENNLQNLSQVAAVDFIGNNIYTAYPTSVTTSIYIKIPQPTKIIIYTNSGEVVRSFELKSSQNINVSDLNNGHYQVHFEGSKEIVRFIKM